MQLIDKVWQTVENAKDNLVKDGFLAFLVFIENRDGQIVVFDPQAENCESDADAAERAAEIVREGGAQCYTVVCQGDFENDQQMIMAFGCLADGEVAVVGIPFRNTGTTFEFGDPIESTDPEDSPPGAMYHLFEL